jgi:hypothetical protein
LLINSAFYFFFFCGLYSNLYSLTWELGLGFRDFSRFFCFLVINTAAAAWSEIDWFEIFRFILILISNFINKDPSSYIGRGGVHTHTKPSSQTPLKKSEMTSVIFPFINKYAERAKKKDLNTIKELVFFIYCKFFQEFCELRVLFLFFVCCCLL